ncbi:hypothetical protein LDENG_00286470, partial [Lucifuga dentata]
AEKVLFTATSSSLRLKWITLVLSSSSGRPKTESTMIFCLSFQTNLAPASPIRLAHGGTMRLTGGTTTLCRHGNRWRETSNPIASSRRGSTTTTCMARQCRV